MSTPRRILIASHSPTCTTGYGRVTRRLAHAFRKAGHAVAALGLGFRGGMHELPYKIFSWLDRRPRDSFAGAFREFAPDVLLTIGDPWMFEFLPAWAERRSAAWVAYFPVDGRPVPKQWKPWIAAVDVPVVFCRFTQDLVAAATGKPPGLIYHGVDTKRFRPMDKDKAKGLAKVAGHFVVGTVARNQQRKNLPALLRAFAKFGQDKADVLLYLHTQLRAEWDLKELSRQFGIEGKTRVTADLDGGRGVPDELLATVYNALDLFVLPTMAEGFGLPIMEAQACGVPALVTDFSACSELVPDPIQRLRVKDILVMHRNFEQAIVDTDDIAEKLEHFYRQRAELEALGRRCHEFAQKFEWEIACRQFVELIEKLPAQAVAGGQCPVASSAAAELVAQASPPVVAGDGSQAGRLCYGAQERDRTAAREHERAGRLLEAEQACRRMLTRNPDEASALHLLGVVRGRMGDGGEAVRLLQRAIGLTPGDPAIHNDLGVVHEDRNEFADAAACYRDAVKIAGPQLHRAWVNLCNALVQDGKPTEALDACAQAVRLRPDFAPAHNARGLALAEVGRVADARSAFEEAVRLRPEYGEAHCNMGLTLLRQGEMTRGWPEHEWRRKDPRRSRNWEGSPWDGRAELSGRSILLFGEGGLGNVIQFARFAPIVSRMGARVIVECQPALVDLLRTMEGIEVVATGQAASGDRPPEFHCPLMSLPAMLSGRPTSDGASSVGSAQRTVVSNNGASDRVPSQPPSQPSPGVPGEGENADTDVPAPRTDLQPSSETVRGADPTGIAPGLSATTVAAIPSDVPYLHPDAELVQRWARKLDEASNGQPTRPQRRIGVCWRGDPQRLHMRDRSFDPAELRPIAHLPGVMLVNLQYGEPAPGALPMVTLPGLEPNAMRLLDVAGVMKSLDLVVTCDTSIAHLAGALGLPAWVALKSSACWRWLLDRADSPWYPSLRLFRQEKAGDWAGVFQRMAETLSSGQKDVPASPASQIAIGSEQDAAADARVDAGAVEYFGTACVLNLDSEPDRMARTAARLERLGIPYERFAALTAPPGMRPRGRSANPGPYACAMSHRAIIQQALDRGLERVLIFEDDVVLRDDVGQWLRRIVPQLREVDWDVFYLGLHLADAGSRRGKDLLEVRRGYHAHAYAVARKAMPRLIAHIDQILADLAGTFDGMEDPSLLKVCASPILAIQEPNFSRTLGREVNRLAQYFTLFDRAEFQRHCREMDGWKAIGDMSQRTTRAD